MTKNILTTGANGQLGQALQELVINQKESLSHLNFFFTDKDTLDITNIQELQDFTKINHIDTIVNCAAYTQVDKAEEFPELVDKINREAVKLLAQLSSDKKIRLIHISTDYVFDGNSYTPLREDDPVNPQGAYARSKLAGENEIHKINPDGAIIIRTSWLYSDLNNNFVQTMLKLGKNKQEIDIVCDQLSTPTNAKDLAKAILTILTKEPLQDKSNLTNTVDTYHFSNEGSCSWYDFAQAIFELSNIECKINPINTDQYPTPAMRPHYSVLDKEKIKKTYQLQIPYWRDSLKLCIQSLDTEKIKTYHIGIIGSGFIANGLIKLLLRHPSYRLSFILTRTDINKRSDFSRKDLLTNSLNQLIDKSDLIVECSGDAIYATETIDLILKASIPVVTMNSEFHVTTGSYFADKGLLTEAEGDQPGVLAILHEEALAMGFKPLVYANIKGFLNENPTREDMEYWGKKANISLEMVTSFTDGTKVQIEQALIANGLGADIIQEGLVKLADDDMLHGGTILADKAKELGYPVSDYLLSSKLPAGVFLVVEHSEEQRDSLRYYKLGEGPYYVLERTYHLCHLEIIKTINRVLNGGGVLLNNSSNPRFSIAAIAKRDLEPGEKIVKGIGSFEVRGITIRLKDDLSHVPIGLLANATLRNKVNAGERIRFEDVDMPDSFALDIWNEMIGKK